MTAAAMAERLRDVIAGRDSITLTGESWDDTFAGNVEFAFANGDRVVIFNDCDEFDYVDLFIPVNGEPTTDFDAWIERNPTDLLSDDEHAEITRIFKAAK